MAWYKWDLSLYDIIWSQSQASQDGGDAGVNLGNLQPLSLHHCVCRELRCSREPNRLQLTNWNQARSPVHSRCWLDWSMWSGLSFLGICPQGLVPLLSEWDRIGFATSEGEIAAIYGARQGSKNQIWFFSDGSVCNGVNKFSIVFNTNRLFFSYQPARPLCSNYFFFCRRTNIFIVNSARKPCFPYVWVPMCLSYTIPGHW